VNWLPHHSILLYHNTALATAEATFTKRLNDLHSKMQDTQAAERSCQVRLEEANLARNAANVSLAQVMMEKEKLVKENIDLASVCEELMSIVEGNK
jgi:hypothetical protein